MGARSSEVKGNEKQNKATEGNEIEIVRQLVKLMEQYMLSELTIETKEFSISLRTATSSHGCLPKGEERKAITREVAMPLNYAVNVGPQVELHHITSPLTGVFYSRPAPQEPPFVEVGSHVEAGQVVALVEAMKVFNEIVSDVEGVVVEIKAKDGQLVNQGDTLMLLKRTSKEEA
jgi:acetyl-CoA carboxylase biotin carboxyl carrier protein